MKHKGFTLAEVLITLGIIGVVAAMTLPGLIQNYQKKVTATKLKKFYSTMNQAIKLSEADNGDCDTWEYPTTIENLPVFVNKYLSNYIKTVSIEYYAEFPILRFSDGSAVVLMFSFDDYGLQIVDFFYIQKPSKSLIEILEQQVDASNYFDFSLYAGTRNDWGVTKKCTLWAKPHYWDGSRETLIQKCKENSPDYCTYLIQYDGWEIKDDYPW